MSPDSSPYRFVIVLVVALGSFLGNFVIFQMAGLAPQVIEAAGLSPSDFGLVVGISILTAAVLGLPLGALGDRLGVKPVVGVAIAVTILGCLGRYLASPSFGSYLFWMFLVGSTNAALNANFIKILGLWLPPRNIGLGVGCYLTGIGLGQAVSIAAGPRFSGLGPAFFFAIILSAVIFLLWVALIKNPPNAPKAEPRPISETLRYVATKRDIWVGGLGIFAMLGTYVALCSFVSTFLVEVKGVEVQKAGLSASAVSLFMLIGALLADRLAKAVGNSRIFLFLSGLLAAIGVIFAMKLDYGPMTLVALSLTGLASGAYCSYILSLPMLLSYVGPVYAGSAGGLISTLQSAGGFFLPYLFPALAGDSQSALFIWMAVGFLAMGLITLPLPQLVKK
jgi:NNP family nitrate/nitrite transporter-like MFS transporter